MNLLVAIDFSEAMERVLQETELLAKALSARVWLLHVAPPEPDFVGYEPGPQTERDLVARHRHQEHRQLQKKAQELRGKGIETTALLVQGVTSEAILEEAEKMEAGMIIMGSHGHGAVYHLLVGSASKGVLHHAKIPVLVVPTHTRPK
jgi:nucleotide-binding universal stress UspA family protein